MSQRLVMFFVTQMLFLVESTAQQVGTQSDTLTPTPQAFCCRTEQLGVATLELGALQVVPWYFNRHVADDSTAVLTFDSWKRNIEQGFEWDPNNFYTNMFMHPYHGHVFFNAGRANGFSHWEATAFAWVGSFVWEFFGENNRPAINDWVNTSMGGISIGEAFYRTSNMLLDNTARGAGRAFRELGALVINPVAGLNRLVRGEATRVGPNPDDRFPSQATGVGQVGVRSVGDGNLENGRTNAYLDLEMFYGNPFTDYHRPFDSFLLAVQLNTAEQSVLGRLQIEGMLFGKTITSSASSRHVLGISQLYDYVNNETYEVGGQSLAATLLSNVMLSGDWSIRSKLQIAALVISGINSEYATSTGRSYDFGSGAGLRFWAALNRSRSDLLSLLYAGYWSHTLNGATGDHLIHFVRGRAQVPILGSAGLGAELIWAVRNSFYRDFPNVSTRNPQVRVFLASFVR